ncbi:MAG TPA: DoxX family protein [Gaiellaceae bacterium]
MAFGILLLRVVLGLTMAAHGAQKLFGWWNGPGLKGVHGWLASMRFRGGWLPVILLVAAELGGGGLLALGLFVPFAALGIVVVMAVAIALVHWQKGFFNGAGGYEFNLLIAAAAVALAATGGGRFSLDRALGWADNLSGVWWGVGVLAAGVLLALFTITVGRRREARETATRDSGLRTA